MARVRLLRNMMRFIRSVIGRWFQSDQSTTKQLTAHHEAGHAVAAVALGIGLNRVSAIGDRDTLGRIALAQAWPHLQPRFNPHDLEDRRIAEGWILLAFAGQFADAYRSGRNPDRNSHGAKWDFRRAEDLAKRLYAHPGERNAFLERMQGRTQLFVAEPLRWRQISAVATRLVQLHELDERQVAQIMDEIAAAGDLRGID